MSWMGIIVTFLVICGMFVIDIRAKRRQAASDELRAAAEVRAEAAAERSASVSDSLIVPRDLARLKPASRYTNGERAPLPRRSSR